MYAVFTCEMDDQSGKAFAVWTFFNGAAKQSIVDEMKSTENSLKIGPFFMVVESRPPCVSNRIADYVGFPGELWKSDVTHQFEKECKEKG